MPTNAQVRVIDPILSTVVQGYIHPEHVGMALFPRVPVAQSGGKIIEFGKEAFRLYSTTRAPGTKTKRVRFGYEGKPYALENHALDAVVPREHLREAQVPGIPLASRATLLTMSAMSLSLEKQQADLARAAGGYDASHKVTLAGNSQWNDAASTPITDVEAAKEAIRSSVGVYPNVMEISAKAFKDLKEHADILNKIKYTERGVVTADLLAAIFDIPKVVIGKAIGFDDAGASIDFWGKDVVLAYVPTVINGLEEPSYGYTYAMDGHPLTEVPFYDNGDKSWIYGVSYERAPVLSGITSGYLIQNAVA